MDGAVADLGPPKQRAVLAILLMHAGEIVSTERLIDLLWGERPPRTAAHSVQIYISELRRALEPLGDGRVIVTRHPGYPLQVPPNSIDALLQVESRTLHSEWTDRPPGDLAAVLATHAVVKFAAIPVSGSRATPRMARRQHTRRSFRP